MDDILDESFILKEAIEIIKSLKYGCTPEYECFCDISIGHPMMSGHNPSCVRAMAFLKKIGE